MSNWAWKFVCPECQGEQLWMNTEGKTTAPTYRCLNCDKDVYPMTVIYVPDSTYPPPGYTNSQFSLN